MITFNISNELFADDAIVTISCKHLPDMFKMPHRCNPNEVSVLKKKTITIALKELVRRMAVQRYESLRHSNFLKSEHLKAHSDIIHALSYYQLENLDVLEGVFNNKIIPCLEVLKPGKDSRYFENYEAKLNDIKAFIETMNSNF